MKPEEHGVWLQLIWLIMVMLVPFVIRMSNQIATLRAEVRQAVAGRRRATKRLDAQATDLQVLRDDVAKLKNQEGHRRSHGG